MIGRVVITLLASFTVYRLIQLEGYRVEPGDLLITTGCVVLLIRMWSYDSSKDGV